jgi:hypothetical protein
LSQFLFLTPQEIHYGSFSIFDHQKHNNSEIDPPENQVICRPPGAGFFSGKGVMTQKVEAQ